MKVTRRFFTDREQRFIVSFGYNSTNVYEIDSEYQEYDINRNPMIAASWGILKWNQIF